MTWQRPLCGIAAPLLLATTLVSLAPRAATQGAFCIPDGWQSGRAVTLAVSKNGSTKPVITRSMGDVIYSSSQQKMLIDDFMMVGGGGEPMTRIYNYPEKILYTVRGEDGDKNQTCVKTPLTSPFQPLCMPVNATMTKYKSYYGVTQPYVQFFMEFVGKVKDDLTDNDVSYRVSLTREHETPLFQQMWGARHGEKFFQTSEFYNSTIWGNMPSNIFQPPKICNNVSLTEVPFNSPESGIGLASILLL